MTGGGGGGLPGAAGEAGWAAVGFAIGFAVVGAALIVVGVARAGGPPAFPDAPPAQIAAGLDAVWAPLGLPRSAPVALDIPRIDVHTTVIGVGLTPGGAIDVPAAEPGTTALWYRYLAAPGQVGPAVILGHVDTAHAGPAVFYRLGELAPGDTVAVRRADGVTAKFVVAAMARYPKSAFPSSVVYGSTDRPVLRLITCGGDFDRAREAYRDNIVVFAALVP